MSPSRYKAVISIHISIINTYTPFPVEVMPSLGSAKSVVIYRKKNYTVFLVFFISIIPLHEKIQAIEDVVELHTTNTVTGPRNS